jgi:CDP-glucose 4,6-dehydratase
MSVIDLVRRILALMGKPHLEPRILNEASHEIPQQYLDCAKARRMMGWHPSFTMDEGLREAIEWYRERLGPIGADRRLVNAEGLSATEHASF